MNTRNQWSVGKVYHATAGELHDGIRLIGKDGNWQASVAGKDGDTLTGIAPTELHARLAACVSAWKAQAERSVP